MTTIVTAIEIRRPVEQVFNYVTTSGNWTRWHPSSLGVSGATDHPMDLGEEVTEKFLVAGRRGEIVWTVCENDPPWKWVIAGETQGGVPGRVTYLLRPHGNGTSFVRIFDYSSRNLLQYLLDRLVVRRKVTAESEEAVHRLKQVLEAGIK